MEKELVKKYGTPLYIYDENHIRKQINLLKENFKSSFFKTNILYASKAFSIKEMYRIAKDEGIGVDVVSKGEMFTAFSTGFPMENVYFHGNNKTEDEMELAFQEGVNHFVVDNPAEMKELAKFANEYDRDIICLLRINLGIDAHTHKYIITSSIDSKFGMEYKDASYEACMKIVKENPHLLMEGFHSHIGSQIFEIEPFLKAIGRLQKISHDFNQPITLDLGGGFGVMYTNQDAPIPLDEIAKSLIQELEKDASNIKEVLIEPGRSIVGEAGSTLYTINKIKETRTKCYYFIDGGMSDNIRPALYQAKYSAQIVGKNSNPHTVTVAGKCCESGDIIIENIELPQAFKGDILKVNTTGAYGYSMASNYNCMLKPGVVFIKDGKDRLVVKRETLEDLIKDEL